MLVIGFPELSARLSLIRLKSEHSSNAVLNNYHLYIGLYFFGFFKRMVYMTSNVPGFLYPSPYIQQGGSGRKKYVLLIQILYRKSFYF
jgi:hypothetical protein